MHSGMPPHVNALICIIVVIMTRKKIDLHSHSLQKQTEASL